MTIAAQVLLQISHPPKKARYSGNARFLRKSFPPQPIPEDGLSNPKLSCRFAVAPFGVFGVTAQRVENLVGGHCKSRFSREKPKCLYKYW
jgi:hypothetical protein